MNAKDKKLIMFDLDGTLTKSKSPIEPIMANLVTHLLEKKKVCIISGGGFPQFQKQVLAQLPSHVENYTNLYLMPTSGTRLYIWKGDWKQEYAEDISQVEKEKILNALKVSLKMAGYAEPEKVYGPLIEDRGSQITFSALGQSAPVEAKYAWDPSRSKRESIAKILGGKIPEFDVRIGGATSIDITRKGVNKGYGIRKLEQYLNISTDDILFVGDALFLGGNDYPAKAAGVDCIQVAGPEETQKLIENLLA